MGSTGVEVRHKPKRVKLTLAQWRALGAIAEHYPSALVEQNCWTSASSLIRKGLVRKAPVDGRSQSAYRLTANGVDALRVHFPLLWSRINDMINQEIAAHSVPNPAERAVKE